MEVALKAIHRDQQELLSQSPFTSPTPITRPPREWVLSSEHIAQEIEGGQQALVEDTLSLPTNVSSQFLGIPSPNLLLYWRLRSSRSLLSNHRVCSPSDTA